MSAGHTCPYQTSSAQTFSTKSPMVRLGSFRTVGESCPNFLSQSAQTFPIKSPMARLCSFRSEWQLNQNFFDFAWKGLIKTSPFGDYSWIERCWDVCRPSLTIPDIVCSNFLNKKSNGEVGFFGIKSSVRRCLISATVIKCLIFHFPIYDHCNRLNLCVDPRTFHRVIMLLWNFWGQ